MAVNFGEALVPDMLWIPLTIAAAFLQTLRTLLQKRLTGALSVNAAAYVRFCFGLPLACGYLALLLTAEPLPSPTAGFWAFCVSGALAQVLATAALLGAFTQRSFAVGTALSKTEVVQTALIGLLLLGEGLPAVAWIGILVSVVGVLLMSSTLSVGELARQPRGLALGLVAGAGFAVAAVGFRGASLSLAEGSTFMRAGLTLTVALGVQTLAMGVFLALREPGQLGRVVATWRRGIWVGITGAVASAGWFTAMTLQTSALVRALGQVELVFALLASHLLLKERINRREAVGMALLAVGVWLVL